jgi:class 3 adenylate cyclase
MSINELIPNVNRLRFPAELEKSFHDDYYQKSIVTIHPAQAGGRPPQTIAEHFEGVTVLFVDIVGFTSLSATIAPGALVSLLNEVFSLFDHLAEKHGLEKIKTIGDAYMAVAGLPMPRPDHAEAVAQMALDMKREITQVAGGQLQVRIGIHTGPVVAGVIGQKKFSYDLWGILSTRPAAMESHGIVGGIQVTAETFQRLENEYHFEQRGLIAVKGKGELTTYLLTGKKFITATLATE